MHAKTQKQQAENLNRFLAVYPELVDMRSNLFTKSKTLTRTENKQLAKPHTIPINAYSLLQGITQHTITITIPRHMPAQDCIVLFLFLVYLFYALGSPAI